MFYFSFHARFTSATRFDWMKIKEHLTFAQNEKETAKTVSIYLLLEKLVA
jgi:hypothetical protein